MQHTHKIGIQTCFGRGATNVVLARKITFWTLAMVCLNGMRNFFAYSFSQVLHLRTIKWSMQHRLCCYRFCCCLSLYYREQNTLLWQIIIIFDKTIHDVTSNRKVLYFVVVLMQWNDFTIYFEHRTPHCFKVHLYILWYNQGNLPYTETRNSWMIKCREMKSAYLFW